MFVRLSPSFSRLGTLKVLSEWQAVPDCMYKGVDAPTNGIFEQICVYASLAFAMTSVLKLLEFSESILRARRVLLINSHYRHLTHLSL